MICENVQKLIDYALANSLIPRDDEYVVRNQLMEALKLTDWQECTGNYSGESIDDILAPLISYAIENGMIADTANSRDLFDTKLMGILTPMPREIIAEFRRLYAESPKKATDWYFDISQKLNYVRAGRIAKDMKWLYDCEYGTLDITINCSKPEKDPRDIAAARNQKASAYPKCQLCPENAGFPGHATHPARQNLRPIPLTVSGEEWQIQYSPYGYYNEHCIVFNEKHIPMKIDRSVFDKLFDIIDYLPHYMVGSNADLPIVGGSILSHEHFQGGGYTFAMAKAPVETPFSIPAYPNVEAGILKWPMSVIRVSSTDRHQLAECCNDILVKWRAYSDESAFIFAETDGVPHNTITPIARRNGDKYECDLVLRNNITTEDRPLGVFHPKPSLHHIKKENIGLIEVMGLAVLPSRLKQELFDLADLLVARAPTAGYPEALQKHAEWAQDILDRHPELNADNVHLILQDEVGHVFEQVLVDAGVYKLDEAGRAGFERFLASI